MTETSETRRASCHCGAVVIEALFPRDLAAASRCTCTFCRRRAVATVTALAETVTVLKGAENLTLYTWGTHTAQHYFCKTCGIYTHHRRRSNPDECGVNLGAIDGVSPWEMEPLPYSDGINHPSDRKGD